MSEQVNEQLLQIEIKQKGNRYISLDSKSFKKSPSFWSFYDYQARSLNSHPQNIIVKG